MSDINFDKYGNEEFFRLFLEAVKETYGDYCQFKEREENLTEYSEPVFEKSIEEAENRLASVEQQLAKANARVRELERTLKQILGWRELREQPSFPVERIEGLCREQLRKGGES